MDHSRLSMPIGEAMFTQRAIRRFRPDPIPLEDIQLILEAAVKAPNGGNLQVARFLVVDDPTRNCASSPRCTTRRGGRSVANQGFTEWPDLPRRYHPAAALADVIGDVPCVVFALGRPQRPRRTR